VFASCGSLSLTKENPRESGHFAPSPSPNEGVRKPGPEVPHRKRGCGIRTPPGVVPRGQN
jgi:hypothetical protein